MTIGDGSLTFTLTLKSYGVVGGCTLDYSVSPVSFFCFLSYEIEIGDGTGPELDKMYYYLRMTS